MTYATQSHLTDRYGTDMLLQLTDRASPPAGAVDADVVARALADADALVDSYIGRKYELPLAATPAVLTTYAAQVAFYLLHRDRPTEEARRDYEDARTWLKDVAAGRAEIQVAGVEPESTSDGLETSGPDRVFTRTKLEGF
jgi:phage gp36-like protein